MPLSQAATVIAIVLLFTGTYAAAEDRSASNRQRYTIHVPEEVKFGLTEPAAADKLAAQDAKEDTESLVFMAETTSGVTIQFETEAEPARKQPLHLTVGDSRLGSWWAQVVADAEKSSHELVAEGTRVQASTLGAGWTTLQLRAMSTAGTSAANLTTIVITIVAH